ncbi:MAG: redoxin domain-containing protein [Elusimicrobia bacterium]|nr:redoxin domain-containing protein [Elusimicrobiota bacterium]
MSTVAAQDLVKVGDPAPDFSLKDQGDQDIRLSDFKGKKNVVLAFFPLAFSPVCTKENECFSRDFDQFAQAGAEVLGISVDSGWTLKAWAKVMDFRHKLLSDFQREVSKKYGLLLTDKNFAQRATVIVDKQGNVAWVKVQPAITTAREDAEIFEALKKLG